MEDEAFAADIDEAWRVFLAEPAREAERSRLSACFGGALPPGICSRLAAGERFQERLSARLAELYGLAPIEDGPIDDVDRVIALFPSDRLSMVSRRAGVIYWSGALANVVLARDVAILSGALGEELYTLALANRDLAGPVSVFPDLDAAATTITEDGWRCLSAWCAALPSGVGQRVRLKLPPGPALDAPVEPALAGVGPDIVRRAALFGVES